MVKPGGVQKPSSSFKSHFRPRTPIGNPTKRETETQRVPLVTHTTKKLTQYHVFNKDPTPTPYHVNHDPTDGETLLASSLDVVGRQHSPLAGALDSAGHPAGIHRLTVHDHVTLDKRDLEHGRNVTSHRRRNGPFRQSFPTGAKSRGLWGKAGGGGAITKSL